MREPPIIEARDLSRTYVSTRKAEGFGAALKMLLRPERVSAEALKDVRFEVQRGEFLGLIGANGAGKTTLLKILSGLIPPSAGSARVMEFVPFERARGFRERIALVMGQKAQLWWDLPAADAFELLKAIYDIPEADYRARLGGLAETLSVQGLLNTQIRRLSLGERMKMELIGAILHWPEVIFLDEPTIGLDVLAAQRLRDFLADFNRSRGATILLTSHNMEDIERLCPRVLILRAGELIYDGSPNRFAKRGLRHLRVRLLPEPGRQELAELLNLSPDSLRMASASPGIDARDQDEEAPDQDPPGIHIALPQERVAEVLQLLMQRYEVVDLGISEPSLESAIHSLYSERP